MPVLHNISAFGADEFAEPQQGQRLSRLVSIIGIEDEKMA